MKPKMLYLYKVVSITARALTIEFCLYAYLTILFIVHIIQIVNIFFLNRVIFFLIVIVLTIRITVSDKGRIVTFLFWR